MKSYRHSDTNSNKYQCQNQENGGTLTGKFRADRRAILLNNRNHK